MIASRPSIQAITALGALALALSGCAEPNAVATTNGHGAHEHFAPGKYGVTSARVVTSGAVPKGGGQYLVGRPYHIAGRTYVPTENDNYSATGMASWYGDAFHGRRTANGEIYDMAAISAAHPTMPLPSYARVTNLSNGNSIIVRVNDRGPYAAGRVMDVSSRVADLLGFKGAGTGHVHIEYVGKAPIEGSSDQQLASSLRTDGQPAQLDGLGGSVFASAPAAPPPPEPKAVAVALAPAAPQAPAEPEPAPAPIAVAAMTPVKSPLPPERPFDLSALPADPIAPSVGGPAPPARPAANGALYFAEPPRRTGLTAFKRLDMTGALPLTAGQ